MGFKSRIGERPGLVRSFCEKRAIVRSAVSRRGNRIMCSKTRCAGGTRWAGASARRTRPACVSGWHSAPAHRPETSCGTGRFVLLEGHLRDVAGGFLDAHDVFDCGEALYRCGLDVHAGAPLHAVKNDGQRHGCRDGAIVLIQTLLRRLVVIRSDGEYAVGAKSGKLAREGDHFRGVVTAGAREDGHLALSKFDSDLHDAEMLLACECRALAGSAARNEEVDACLDLSLDQLAQRLFVERTVFPKWRNKSRPGSNKHCVSPSLIERPTAENHRWRPEGRCCISAQFAENFTEFEYTLLSGDPARGSQRSAGKSVAAARRVTQCDGVHRRVKSNFMCARMRTSAIGRQRERAVVAGGADPFGKFLECAGRRIFFGGVVNFPTPCLVFWIFRKEGGGACNCLKEDVDADGEIRAVNKSSAARENGFVDRGESFEPAGSAANGADAKRSEAAEIVGRGTGSGEFHGDVDATHGL